MTTDVNDVEVAPSLDVVDNLPDGQQLIDAAQAYGDDVSPATAGDSDDPSKRHVVPLGVPGGT
jgi:hypothetical protein